MSGLTDTIIAISGPDEPDEYDDYVQLKNHMIAGVTLLNQEAPTSSQ
jgi:hypothetical protein